jgi:hypothetical protein
MDSKTLKKKWQDPKYREQMRVAHLGQKAWNKGRKESAEHKKKLSLAHIGVQANEKHPFWQGDKVNYRNLHTWVVRWKGQPKICEKCGKSGLSGKMIHWANIDHKYRRVLDDFIRLCAKCHKQYDKQFK